MRKLTLETVKERVKVAGLSIEILSTEYERAHDKLKCKCLIDGYEWGARASSLAIKHGCPRCGDISVSKKRRSNFKGVVENIRSINSDIDIIGGEYVNNRSKLNCRCNVCDNQWEANSNNLLSGKGCPRCATNITAEAQRFSLEEVEKRINKNNSDIQILSTRYKGAHGKLKVKCRNCFHEWEASANNLSRGYGCPGCNESKGEKKVENWLKLNHVQYKRQHRFAGCRYKNTLPFDFAIFNKDKLISLIEYQGIQHYRVNEYYGGTGAFNYLKNNDRIKHDYCKVNGIRLIEIPYTIKDVEGFLRAII